MSGFIPVSMPSITELEIKYVEDAVRSTWISSLGKYINQFEEQFAAYCGVRYGVAVSNGTVSIQLLLRAMNIGEGDEVIIPDLTFIATANAVLHAGATPVFTDIDSTNLCLDPKLISDKITTRTKAIMPVHLYGHPADMNAIKEVGNKHGIPVLEDAAEAHGSEINGKRVGGIGEAACFSFYGNKNFTTGEGGMITTSDASLSERCRFLRDQAMDAKKRYWHPEPGFNFRITNLQAAIGCAQLERADELIGKRQEIFRWYQKGLASLEEVRINRTYAWAKNTYWMVCLESDNFSFQRREHFMTYLKEQKVDSRPYFYPCSTMPYFKDAHNSVCQDLYSKGINLPTYFDLKEEQVEYICKVIKTYFKDQNFE